MHSTIVNLLTGSVTCLLIGIVCNSLTNPCFASPVDANRVALAPTKLENSQKTSKPLIISKGNTCLLTFYSKLLAGYLFTIDLI